jgi:hypothetical protein
MWFVFLIAAVGLLALGLVVVNAGALFRIRYVFWMMLIILSSRGLEQIRKRTSQEEGLAPRFPS